MSFHLSDLFAVALAALMIFIYGYLAWFKPQKFRDLYIWAYPYRASLAKSRDFIWFIWMARIVTLLLLIMFLGFSLIYALEKLGFNILFLAKLL